MWWDIPQLTVQRRLQERMNNQQHAYILNGINTPSVKRQRQRQGPIGIHCDAPKWVPDPFPSVNPSVKTSKLPLGLFIAQSYLKFKFL